MTAEQVIERLELKPLADEGGFFRQSYACSLNYLGAVDKPARCLATAIYYLVTPVGFSALHRIKSDEVFHFYLGDPVEMVQFEHGNYRRLVLGQNILKGELLQTVVASGVWQGTRLVSGGRWALLGTTVSPGFDFEDFELADRTILIKQFPEQEPTIRSYTRP